ncbi:MAG: hypothetical protein H0V44_13945 [Planctomycetes bacterium]|nr:hypothetical protein [Planctomycetota bacterium]
MYTLYRLLRNLIRSIASAAEPWQIALGTFFGTLLGFMPIWPLSQGPSPLGLSILVLALLVNCHLGSVFLFMGTCKLLSLALMGIELNIGQHFSALAQWSADQPFFYLSLWSHTGYLGKTLVGMACAPIFAAAMWWVTVTFRTKLMAKLMERRRLMTAGKFANNPWLFRLGCWFFGV